MKKYYDAEYIIRKNNEYEELRLYYSPTEIKLRNLIAEATIKCNLQNEKYKKQKEKLEEKRLERLNKKQQEEQIFEREM